MCINISASISVKCANTCRRNVIYFNVFTVLTDVLTRIWFALYYCFYFFSTVNFSYYFQRLFTYLLCKDKYFMSSAVGTNFWFGRGAWFVTLSYEYNKNTKIYTLCLFLAAAYYIVYWINLFFFLKMTKIKAIKGEIQNKARFWTNPL